MRKETRKTTHLSEDAIRDVQIAVDRTIRNVGGYWRPLSALARLLEELGELAEMLMSAEPPLDDLAAELADAMIISTCLANQYRCDLGGEYSESQAEFGQSEQRGGIDLARSRFLDVVAWSGDIGRVLNSYEGDKPPREGDAPPTLGRALAGFQLAVIQVAESLRVPVWEWIERKLAYALERDSKRFSPAPDPITVECLARFQRIIDMTQCPFAAYSKLWGLPDWDPSKSVADNARASAPTFLRFERVALPERLDGLILEVKDTELCKTLNQVCATFREILEVWGQSDPSGCNCMTENLLHPDWQFRFSQTRYFVSVFAPCYPHNHPRFSCQSDAMFLFLQPEFSFDFHGIHSANRELARIKSQIRGKFSMHGSGYSGKLVDDRIEALIYILPIGKDDQPIHWWLSYQEGKL